jgi:hypothetical protein
LIDGNENWEIFQPKAKEKKMGNDDITNQRILGKCILNLVNQFLEEPFTFFNEADAVTRFHQLLVEEPALNRKIQTWDEYKVSRIHREYPIPPFVNEKGNYDTVILNPEYTMLNLVDNVARPGPGREPREPENVKPFLAVVEFKLFYESLGKGRANTVLKDLDRLNASARYSEFAYLVYLQRYLDEKLNQWSKNWPLISDEAKNKDDIGSIAAIHWRWHPEKQNLYRFGRWLQH